MLSTCTLIIIIISTEITIDVTTKEVKPLISFASVETCKKDMFRSESVCGSNFVNSKRNA